MPRVVQNGIELRLIGERASVTLNAVSQSPVQNAASPAFAISSSGDGLLIVGIPAVSNNVQIAESKPSLGLAWYSRATSVFAGRAYTVVAVGDMSRLQLFTTAFLSHTNLAIACDGFGYGVRIATAPWNTLLATDRDWVENKVGQALFRYRALGFPAPKLRRVAVPSIHTNNCGAYELNLAGLSNAGDSQFSGLLGAYNAVARSIVATDTTARDDLIETYIHELFHSIHQNHIGQQAVDLWVTEGLAVLAQRSMQNIGGKIQRSAAYPPRPLDIGLLDDSREFEYQTQDFFADLLGRQLQQARGSFGFVANMIKEVRNTASLNSYLQSRGTSLVQAYQNYVVETLRQYSTKNSKSSLFEFSTYSCLSDDPVKFAFYPGVEGLLSSKLVLCPDFSGYKIESTPNLRVVHLDSNFQPTAPLQARAILVHSTLSQSRNIEVFSLQK
jgi:hypothetical protein